MPQSIRIFLFLLVVLFANIMQTITGFAGTVLAMPFSIILIGSDLSRLILNILGLLASLGVAVINFKSINWKEVIKICVIMLVGMVAGYLILGYAQISKQILLIILAAFVLLFTIIGCYTTFIKKEKVQDAPVVVSENGEVQQGEVTFKEPIYKEILLYAILVVSGVVHGMYVCGGPLLIIYATKKLKGKDEFRSTLSFVWVVLNIVNLVRDIIAGNFAIINSIESIAALVMAIFLLIAAISIGTLLARRMDKKKFMIVTYVLMAISAISLILNACGVF